MRPGSSEPADLRLAREKCMINFKLVDCAEERPFMLLMSVFCVGFCFSFFPFVLMLLAYGQFV